jgi:uncharacterized membrane protein
MKKIPTPIQRKTLNEMFYIMVVVWVIALATLVFADFRTRVVPFFVAVVISLAYFAIRIEFDLKKPK